MELQHNQSGCGKQKQVIGVPINSQDYRYWIAETVLPHHQHQILPSPSKITHGRVHSAITKVVKLRESINTFAQGIREHVRLGAKLGETVKGKLRLGARILQLGGVDKIFEKNFKVIDGETLFNASQCYLSTTAGPIAGLLFVSTHRIGFCSDTSIKLKLSSSNGNLLKLHYKVMIPLTKIKRAVESENVKKPPQKYLQIVTDDDFEFWFMGFLNHQRTLRHVKHAMHQSRTSDFWASKLVV